MIDQLNAVMYESVEHAKSKTESFEYPTDRYSSSICPR